MEITYKVMKDFSEADLEALFLSVEWSSGKYPEKLRAAMINSHRVYSAWDGEKLVGLMNAISDGYMVAYFPYLLVQPAYQSRGIGKRLVELMLAAYEDCARKTLTAYSEAVGFYENCGFTAGHGKIPMSVTHLTT